MDADYAYASQPSYGEFLNVPRPFERRHAEERVARCVQEDWDQYQTFVLVLEGKVIGQASIEVHDTNWANLGYGILQEHWGKGLVVEAARTLITDLFARVGVARVEISAAAPNHRSRRVAEKLGFTYEGTLRSRMVVREKRYDCAYYGLLPQEWKG